MNLEVCTYGLVVSVNLAVGLRLLWRGSRGRSGPETLLGAAFALDGIEWLLWLLALYTPAVDTPLGTLFSAACRVFIVAHNLCLLAFTRLVFRPESRGALAAVWLSAAVILIGLLGGFATGDWSGSRSDRPWLWLELSGLLVAYAWTLVESGRHYARMRRRHEHGMADAVLTNRFLLWAVYGGATLGTSLVWMFAALVVARGGVYPYAFDAIMIGSTVVAAVAIWFAFFPPSAYRRWLQASGARAAA
jgi:hypothetical protein